MPGPTGQTIHATTSDTGTYSSGALVPGTYSVRAEAKGFKTTQLSVDVQVNNTANGSIKLEIGQESTVVEVQASEVGVNTEQAEVQGVLTASQISNLPVNGRNFLDLAQLEPGVQIQDGANFDPTKVGYSSVSFGGRFGRTARISVDGVDVSDETVGTTTEDIPASSIQEFSLAQSSLDLSNDLTSSGAVNVTTKSGTNAYHGEAFGFFRDSAVGAANLPSPVDPATGQRIPTPWQRNQEGADIGGPIMKDKLFFFLDGERTLQHQAAPVLQAAPFQAYSGTFQSPFKEVELTGRLDYSLTKTARLFGRFNYFQNSADGTFFSSSFSVYNNKDYTRNEVIGLDFNTGGFTHTIRFSYLKFQNQIVDAVTGSNLPFANLGVNIFIGSFSTGPNELAPQSTPQSDHQIKYDGSKTIGKHILRYGLGFNHIQGGGFASFFGTAPQISGATDLRSGTKEAGKAATLNMVEAKTVTQNVFADSLAAVILDLMIALRSALRREFVRARAEASNEDIDPEVGEWQIRPRHGVDDLVLELQIRKANGMGEASGVEIQAYDFISSVVFVVVDRETAREERAVSRILEVVETAKKTRGLGQGVVQAAGQLNFFEGRLKRPRISLERSRLENRRSLVLQGALAVQEEEQLILHDRSANVGAFLVALPGGWDSLTRRWVEGRGQVCGADSADAEEAEGIAVIDVGARLGGHVHRAGRSQIVREIQARLR